MPPRGNGRPCPNFWSIFPCRRYHWRADTAYNAGRLRQVLEERSVTAFIPTHPRQESNMAAGGRFEYHGDHLVCPRGKVLKQAAYHRRNASYQYVAQAERLPGLPHQRTVSSSPSEAQVPGAHHLLPAAAPPGPGKEPDSGLPAGNEPASDSCRGNIRIIGPAGMGEITTEGIVEEPALEKSGVDCEGSMAPVAHNLLKALRRLGHGIGPPAPNGPCGIAELQPPVSRGEAWPNCSRPSLVES